MDSTTIYQTQEEGKRTEEINQNRNFSSIFV
jgi:hypothetical protein